MTYYVYILKSEINNKYYTGYTKNLEERLKRHNTGRSKWTNKFKPWKIIYFEKYSNRNDAFKRESEIKS